MNVFNKTTTLVAARPGLWRNALTSYLKAIPELEVWIPVDDLQTMLQRLSDCPVEYLVLDAGLCPGNLASVLAQVKRSYPGLGCIVLVETADQGMQARASGARHTIFKAFIDNHLSSALFARTPRPVVYPTAYSA
jgi:DNA-binding NarL/FixJ family response regulator